MLSRQFDSGLVCGLFAMFVASTAQAEMLPQFDPDNLRNADLVVEATWIEADRVRIERVVLNAWDLNVPETLEVQNLSTAHRTRAKFFDDVGFDEAGFGDDVTTDKTLLILCATPQGWYAGADGILWLTAETDEYWEYRQFINPGDAYPVRCRGWAATRKRLDAAIAREREFVETIRTVDSRERVAALMPWWVKELDLTQWRKQAGVTEPESERRLADLHAEVFAERAACGLQCPEGIDAALNYLEAHPGTAQRHAINALLRVDRNFFPCRMAKVKPKPPFSLAEQTVDIQGQAHRWVAWLEREGYPGGFDYLRTVIDAGGGDVALEQATKLADHLLRAKGIDEANLGTLARLRHGDGVAAAVHQAYLARLLPGIAPEAHHVFGHLITMWLHVDEQKPAALHEAMEALLAHLEPCREMRPDYRLNSAGIAKKIVSAFRIKDLDFRDQDMNSLTEALENAASLEDKDLIRHCWNTQQAKLFRPLSVSEQERELLPTGPYSTLVATVPESRVRIKAYFEEHKVLARKMATGDDVLGQLAREAIEDP